MTMSPPHPQDLLDPRSDQWDALCAWLDQLEGRALTVALEWAEVQVRHWPAHMRPLPESWVIDLLDGYPQPRLSIGRALTLSPDVVTRDDWAEQVHACDDLWAIEQLWIDRLSVTVRDIGLLTRCECVGGLMALGITRCNLRRFHGRALGCMLASTHLTHLSLAGNVLADLGVQMALDRLPLYQLAHLDLRQNAISDPMIHLISDHFAYLRTLRLDLPAQQPSAARPTTDAHRQTTHARATAPRQRATTSRQPTTAPQQEQVYEYARVSSTRRR